MTTSIKPTDEPDPASGIIVASVTTTRNWRVRDALFVVRRVGTDETSPLRAVGHGSDLRRKSDFLEPDPKRGRLLALAIEPGNYELIRWELHIGAFSTDSVWSSAEPLAALPFSVSPGVVTYIGNLHVEAESVRNELGIPRAGGGVPSITDRHEPDLALMKTKFPNLANLPVNIAVPSSEAWKTAPVDKRWNGAF